MFESIYHFLKRVTRHGRTLLGRWFMILTVAIWGKGWLSFESSEKVTNALGLLAYHPSNGINMAKVFREWKRASSIVHQGDLRRGVRLRQELLAEVYDHFEVPPSQTPIGLAPSWTSNMGHVGWLLAVLSAKAELGMSAESPLLPVQRGLFDTTFLDLRPDLVRPLRLTDGEMWAELPSQWPLFQPLEMLNVRGEFVDSYLFIEKLFQQRAPSPERPLLDFPNELAEKCQGSLKRRFGFSETDWFVALHVKTTPGQSRRGELLESYLGAINEITSRGGWVIRLGQLGEPDLGPHERVIDLSRSQELIKGLQFFALAKCRFFLGSQSGPAQIPPVFGNPTLQSNVTSIGRTTFSWSENSFHVPKLLKDSKGRILPFSDHLRSPEGYGELRPQELAARGYALLPNEGEDITRAVVEMFDRLEGGHRPNSYLLDKVERVRSEEWFATHGEISQSFLEKHLEWLG